jgi:arylsulfatase A-like enzyme
MTMPEKPNILFLFTDQHRLSAAGAYGETPCKTPHIDGLAAEGIRFSRAYTTCPVSSPARASIMTGLFPHAHGITTNIHEIGCCRHELKDSPNLLSRRLQAEGYVCGYSGKWHLGTTKESTFAGPNAGCLPRDVGFVGQDFPGHGGGGFGYPEYRQYLRDKGLAHAVRDWGEKTRRIWPMGILEGPVESTVPYFLVEHTIELCRRFSKEKKPFFIWHNFWGPHGPFFVTQAYIDAYRDVDIPQWENYDWPARDIPGPHQAKVHPEQERLDWDDWAMAIRYYYAFATLIDEQIGRLVVYLRESGLLDSTAVLFSADHGQTLGSHGGLTDKGWHHFEETHRIPLILRMPDRSAGGRVIDEFASLADIHPTLLDLAGTKGERAHGHGQSLLPLIRGEQQGHRDCAVVEFGGLANVPTAQRTIRVGDLKYGFNAWFKDELYDLSRDPHETVNRIDDPAYGERATMLRDRLLRWMEDTADPLRRRAAYFFNRYEKRDIEYVW